MEIDPSMQVIIGSFIGLLLLNLIRLYRSFIQKSKELEESQTMAKWSIIIGLSGIILIFVGSIVGLILGILSMRGKKLKQLSYIGITISILTGIPWLLVLIFGP